MIKLLEGIGKLIDYLYMMCTCTIMKCHIYFVIIHRHTGLKGEAPVALNGFLYTLLRSTKPHRRGILMSILKQFEEKVCFYHNEINITIHNYLLAFPI